MVSHVDLFNQAQDYFFILDLNGNGLPDAEDSIRFGRELADPETVLRTTEDAKEIYAQSKKSRDSNMTEERFVKLKVATKSEEVDADNVLFQALLAGFRVDTTERTPAVFFDRDVILDNLGLFNGTSLSDPYVLKAPNEGRGSYTLGTFSKFETEDINDFMAKVIELAPLVSSHNLRCDDAVYLDAASAAQSLELFDMVLLEKPYFYPDTEVFNRIVHGRLSAFHDPQTNSYVVGRGKTFALETEPRDKRIVAMGFQRDSFGFSYTTYTCDGEEQTGYHQAEFTPLD